jgi:hypothetical protein
MGATRFAITNRASAAYYKERDTGQLLPALMTLELTFPYVALCVPALRRLQLVRKAFGRRDDDGGRQEGPQAVEIITIGRTGDRHLERATSQGS